MEGSRSPLVIPKGGAKTQFSVRRPSFSATGRPLGPRPDAGDLLLLLFFIVASSFCLVYLSSREASITRIIFKIGFSINTAGKTINVVQITIGLFLSMALIAFFRACLVFNAPNLPPKPSPSEKTKTKNLESNKKNPKSKPIYEPLVPIRKPLFTQTPPRVPQTRSDQFNSSAEKKTTISPLSPFRISPVPSWSSRRSGSGKRIQSEAMLEKFLEETDAKIDKIWESPPVSSKKLTGTPQSVTPLSGTGKGTPLRPVRMSPSSSASPKKGDGDSIPPMSMEKTIEGFKHLGIYPQIEQWRDLLRQWFSSVLINPLLLKIKTSHIQVMQAASSVGFSITVSQVGSEAVPGLSSSPVNQWQPIVTLDEDELLYKLQSTLLQSLNKPPTQQTFGSLQQTQQNPPNQFILACLDAVAEHQRLKSLMKGELIKNLLPYSSINANYTVSRVEDLAEGTCLKNYNYMGTGNSSSEKKWTGDLPSDSHLLLYFFAAFLEHPGWMLRVDAQWFSGSESNENPLFLGVLPPKERFPEKYVAVILGAPPVIHPGACVLSVGKQNPPSFCLYWDKKIRFSLQGRTAFWDTILLMCHKINENYGGVVRGVHLGSPALNLLPIFDSDSET